MDSYRRIPLSKPFEGVRRISPELYMSGVASAFLGYQLGRTKSVDDFYRISLNFGPQCLAVAGL